jgi:hypothetical protein
MSAHLTVYAMAFEAEGPLRMREADQARRIALAEASAEPRPGRLLRCLGAAIRQYRRIDVTEVRWTGIGNGGFPGAGQPVR